MNEKSHIAAQIMLVSGQALQKISSSLGYPLGITGVKQTEYIPEKYQKMARIIGHAISCVGMVDMIFAVEHRSDLFSIDDFKQLLKQVQKCYDEA